MSPLLVKSRFSAPSDARVSVDTERSSPTARRLRTRGASAVSDTVILFVIALSELAVVDDVVKAVTERDASDAVAGFAVDTFVEPVASEATAGLVDVATEFAGAELVALVEAGASELTATLGAADVAGATDVAVTVSVATGATVVVAVLSGTVLGEVVVATPSP